MTLVTWSTRGEAQGSGLRVEASPLPSFSSLVKLTGAAAASHTCLVQKPKVQWSYNRGGSGGEAGIGGEWGQGDTAWSWLPLKAALLVGWAKGRHSRTGLAVPG